jgi:tetraacyldisaccharide 4'-kinase
MEQRLTELWYRESAGFSLLQPLSWLYGLVTRLRRTAYARGWFRTQRAGKPVIVVGNLTVGGTGKTPVVAWLAEQLSLSGLKVGIVSRGYGRSKREPEAVHAESSWQDVGDEPMLLWQLTGCDVVVAQDRFAGAQKLVALGVDVIIADDGLQHLRLARDCEIVVIDGARGFGNGRLLPAGPLREPVSRIRHASLVVVNGVPEHASLQAGGGKLSPASLQMSLSGGEAHRLDGLAAPELLEHFSGQRVHGVAGIGNPQRFFRYLRGRGIDVVEHPFPDHHPFTAADLTFGDNLPVLMTQKDAVRCRELENARLWYVPVVARFSEPQGRELLDRVVRTLGPSPNDTFRTKVTPFVRR